LELKQVSLRCDKRQTFKYRLKLCPQDVSK
jgi:hypothetical protein